MNARWTMRLGLLALLPVLVGGNEPAPSLTTKPAEETSKIEPSVRAIADAITELDLDRAQTLLTGIEATPAVQFQRARLAVYIGNCDSGEATLSTLPETPETLNLSVLARNCARATAGSLVIDRPEEGVWIRFQDAEDEVLVPLIAEVATKARAAMVKDLGVDLPRPLRIDVVRDLFSLAAVTGLPLEAAETTGTVAVARWGRVTMISPRAAQHGYPWQDTLAHEVTHLALTRASRDFAPLWIQEGIAKREEVRWREPRPFDSERNPHALAREALLDGTSVGIDRIGPSIAMLPTPRAAAISYAEVESFMDFWIGTTGRAAFALLLHDLKGLGTREPDEALTSITGYPLAYWIARWQEHLEALPDPALPEEVAMQKARLPAAQDVRLGDLVSDQGQPDLAPQYYDDGVLGAPDRAAVRFRAAAARWALGTPEPAREALGDLEKVSGLHGGWLGLHGRILLETQRSAEAVKMFDLAVSVDPIGEAAACEGVSLRTEPGALAATAAVPNLPLPTDPVRLRLCEAARRAARD
jgi:hypothetical protein